MLLGLTLLVLASVPRIEVCGMPMAYRRPQAVILPRTAPEFSPLVRAPEGFREPDERPRSTVTLPCSPALCDEGPPPRVYKRSRFERPKERPIRSKGYKRRAPPRFPAGNDGVLAPEGLSSL